MHELSIAMNLVELAESETRKSGSASIHSVNVVVGKLLGVDIDSLKFMLDIAKKNTLLECSIINFEQVEGKGRCRNCHQEFSVATLAPVCPACHGISVEVTGGEELRIVSMEVE